MTKYISIIVGFVIIIIGVCLIIKEIIIPSFFLIFPVGVLLIFMGIAHLNNKKDEEIRKRIKDKYNSRQ